MKHILYAMTAVFLLGAAGCATDRYPVSGEKCGDCDPVRGMCAPECPPVSSS
ncbi:hypothetical protein [Oricola thermophila]|uniref:Uncharacterized protein n=1 Tax=Oricola thermophila TaxID=2742145 RepID=A0A6N1VEE2_9HYPH|nr:hypothetical protein [Oricola thermophila]QKV19310.1 hypothetical protein HTY61_13005 [Oricola thermophila]